MQVSYPQVVLLGDSLVQFGAELDDGFSLDAALQASRHHFNRSKFFEIMLNWKYILGFNRRLDIVNRGLSGYNTANVLKYLERLIPDKTSSSPELKYLVGVLRETPILGYL